MKPELLKEIPGVCKSSILKFQMKQYYILSITGSKYSATVAQLKYYRTLHTDSHMFFMKIQEEHLDIITAILTQHSLKSGLKEWVSKVRNIVKSDIY